MKKENLQKLKTVAGLLFYTAIGAAIIIFAILTVNLFDSGKIFKYELFIKIAVIFFATLLTVLTIIFRLTDKAIVYKSLITLSVLVAAFLIGFYILKRVGFLDKIDSIEDLQNFISQYGSWAMIVFVVIQFLQVAVIPIPGVITMGAGVALFGPVLGGVLSFIGIMLGSLCAFLIGRKLGYKAASWLVGEDDLKKWMQKLKGKDKLFLTFMFLFPFFPDDILCFVAGLSSMSFLYFLTMITITRIISIFTTTFSVSGMLIPYNTWWGLLIWAALFAVCIYVFYILYKKGDELQKILERLKKKRADKKRKLAENATNAENAENDNKKID